MNRLRFHLKGAAQTTLQNSLAAALPAAWDGDGLRIEVWLAEGYWNAKEPFDGSTIDELTLEIKATPDGDLLAGGPITASAFSACTWAAWAAGGRTDCHAYFELTGTQMNFANAIGRVWLSFRATITGGQPVTFGAGYVDIVESRHGATADPAETVAGGFLYWDGVLNEDKSITVTARGKAFEITPANFRDA